MFACNLRNWILCIALFIWMIAAPARLAAHAAGSNVIAICLDTWRAEHRGCGSKMEN